jgi:SAM-dependent methyltransferase
VAPSDFDDLVEEAEQVPIEGWDFGWLDGRAVEERPSCGTSIESPSAPPSTLLEVQAGVGSMIGRLASLPRLSVATEGFPPSVAIAAPRLRSTGVHLVVTSQTGQALPFAAGSFELVISRHPIEVWWREIARVLRPGGIYFAQHVGPHSLRSLSEFLMGRLPNASNGDTEVERRAAEAAGLVVQSMRLEHPRTAFFDIGAVVYFLRSCPGSSPASPC